jgi:two-component system sensor histidine kinase PilS (NtrC family)
MLSGLRTRLERLMLFRVVMVTLLLGSAIVVNINDAGSFTDPSYLVIFGLIIGTYVATIFYALMMGRVRLEGLAYFQLTGDVVVAGGLVYVTGGTESVFAFLFYLTIVNGAILMGRRAAFVTATMCSVVFLFLLLTRMMPLTLMGQDLVLEPPQASSTVYSVAIKVAAFYLIGLLAGYLAKRLQESGTELERQQVDIRELQALYQHILSSITSGVVTLDIGDRVLYMNRAAEDLLGISIMEVYGTPASASLTLIHRAVRKLVRLDNDDEPTHWEGPVGPDRERYVTVDHSMLFDGEGAHYGHVLVIQDLTLIHQMRQSTQRKERLAVVGQLAAALAHEIRNPLASISGSIEMLHASSSRSDDEVRLMEIVIREVERLNTLISEFLNYAKVRRRSDERVSLHDIVMETADLFQLDAVLAHSIILEIDVDECVGVSLMADVEEVRQVFWNLLRNAAQALNGEGEIRVHVKRLKGVRLADGRWDQLQPAPSPEETELLRIRVQDNGPGIPREYQPRIFEPFFTTRKGGTGLGLATIYRIIEDHDGTIEVESDDNGTCFIIDLPVERRPLTELAGLRSLEPPPPRHTGPVGQIQRSPELWK